MPKRRILTQRDELGANGQKVYERKVRKLPPNWKKGAEKRKALLRALHQTGGNISEACKMCDVSRRMYDYYRREYPEFDVRVEEIFDAQIDFVESKLMEQIANGNASSTQFFLKTKGRSRGYAEKTEHSEKRDINVTFTYDVEKSDKLDQVRKRMQDELEAQQRKLEDGNI